MRRAGLARVGIAVAGLLDSAIPPLRRRHAAAQQYRTPTSGALAPPVPTTFEAKAAGPDGSPARVVATAAPGNEISGPRFPQPQGYEKEPEPAGTLSIAEGSGHPAGQKGRAISWIVVAFIALAFVAAGLGLVFGQAWLFIAGLVAVVIGGIAGWAFGIMADRQTDEDQGAQP